MPGISVRPTSPRRRCRGSPSTCRRTAARTPRWPRGRPRPARGRVPSRPPCASRLGTAAGRAAYALRKSIVEPVFGQIKEVAPLPPVRLAGRRQRPGRVAADLPDPQSAEALSVGVDARGGVMARPIRPDTIVIQARIPGAGAGLAAVVPRCVNRTGTRIDDRCLASSLKSLRQAPRAMMKGPICFVRRPRPHAQRTERISVIRGRERPRWPAEPTRRAPAFLGSRALSGHGDREARPGLRPPGPGP